MRRKSLRTVLLGYLELLGFFFSQALKAIMFFGGIALAIICFFVALTSVTDRYQQYQTLLNSISVLLIIISTIFMIYRYFYSYRHKIPLKIINYIALIFCIAFFVSISFTVSEAIFPYDKHPKLVGFLFSLISSFCGIALTWVARLEAPIYQQVKYIASKALKEAPNQQLSSIDLVQHLKRNLKFSDDMLLQHLNACSFLEKIDDPYLHLQFYCLKDKATTLRFPQLLSISNVTLKSNLKKALSFLDEDNVDIGLFMLGREFEATLKGYLSEAYIKGILVNTPGNKDPKDLKLAELVSCLKSNGIVTDDAALSYLRQQRNDRAHGRTPTLAERQLLMRNVQHLANLYIDYIKFFDDRMQVLYVPPPLPQAVVPPPPPPPPSSIGAARVITYGYDIPVASLPGGSYESMRSVDTGYSQIQGDMTPPHKLPPSLDPYSARSDQQVRSWSRRDLFLYGSLLGVILGISNAITWLVTGGNFFYVWLALNGLLFSGAGLFAFRRNKRVRSGIFLSLWAILWVSLIFSCVMVARDRNYARVTLVVVFFLFGIAGMFFGVIGSLIGKALGRKR